MSKKQEDNLQELEQRLNYTFNDKTLLQEALTHPSVTSKNHKIVRAFNYERLEFLGDAVLNFLISHILFIKYKNYQEGKLATLRSSLVCKKQIYDIAQQIGIADFINMTCGEERGGGRSNPGNLENAMEAIIGAVFLDGGLGALYDIIEKFWVPFFETVDNREEQDPKSTLQEWSQSQKKAIPIYQLVKKMGSDHEPSFKVRVIIGGWEPEIFGYGSSIKAAQKDAARKVLEFINASKT